MKIFALDTAAKTCSVALAEDESVLYEESLSLGLTHSETMQEACNRALATLDWTYQDIDLYTVTHGPGSFTGLRIGLTAAKTFAYATNKPILGLSSLKALAEPYHCGPKTAVLSLLDARHRRVFSGLYQNSQNLVEEQLGEIDDYLVQAIHSCQANQIKNLILVGDCAEKYAQDEAIQKQVQAAKLDLILSCETSISAASLARLAFQTHSESPELIQNAAALKPLYLTATEAERGANFYV